MLTWTEHRLPTKGSVWYADGGGGMAVVRERTGRFELLAWWKEGKGDLTTQPVSYPTLAEAMSAAQHLIFSRVDAWTRLLTDDPT